LLYVAAERPGLRMRARMRPAAHDDEVPLAQ
jgi:hypothetical protein